jgi:hypothetical protein
MIRRDAGHRAKRALRPPVGQPPRRARPAPQSCARVAAGRRRTVEPSAGTQRTGLVTNLRRDWSQPTRGPRVSLGVGGSRSGRSAEGKASGPLHGGSGSETGGPCERPVHRKEHRPLALRGKPAAGEASRPHAHRPGRRQLAALHRRVGRKSHCAVNAGGRRLTRAGRALTPKLTSPERSARRR